LLRRLKAYAKALFREEAKVYYFATSLPARLLFENLQRRQETTALLIEGEATLGLGEKKKAGQLFRRVLKRDPSRALARDFLDMVEDRVIAKRQEPNHRAINGRAAKSKLVPIVPTILPPVPVPSKQNDYSNLLVAR
jgi:hypothetical protein